MTHTLETVLGPVEWEADDNGFSVAFFGRHSHARWSEITAAGLVEATKSLASLVPYERMMSVLDNLPGWNTVQQINEHLGTNYRILVLARGPSPNRAIRIPVPLGNEMTAALLNEVQQRLPGRWCGEIPLGANYERLGQTKPWWTIPLAILLGVPLGLMILFACAGFVMLQSELQGDSMGLPREAWIVMGTAMALWLLLIGGILLAYRRMWWRRCGCRIRSAI